MGAGLQRLSLAFINHGGGEGATSRLSIAAPPKTLVPKLRIDWPVADGDPPLQTSYLLRDRCCYWHFYEPDFKMPESAVAGNATITVSFEGEGFPFELVTDQIVIPVVARDSDTAAK